VGFLFFLGLHINESAVGSALVDDGKDPSRKKSRRETVGGFSENGYGTVRAAHSLDVEIGQGLVEEAIDEEPEGRRARDKHESKLCPPPAQKISVSSLVLVPKT